ncbi:electron transport complex protein RnfA [Candidatus Xianfuyuplasma coldseepsis]|uniref:Electron transport complex subunit RsxA n=1 Tax=Candidatus Xianfuyuplasma coldseepsis TaxID=2782163 RepID=A0A7L7KPD6_9MOLU|nr:Rnf-Nqr domain containing protein [Xianfuyuplasma coldseepsis]QMS84289.1 electron transport complex subunit RsxA [Xianfuyuplasma coldseepsis]
MQDLISLAFTSFLVQNIILSQFLGICSFLGVSNKRSKAIGMGVAVFVVITLSSMLTWTIYYYILVPGEITFMRTIVFILVIAGMVQILEMAIKKFNKNLYSALGVYLPLITTNCAVLGVAILNIQNNFTFVETITFSAFTSLGYTAIIVVFSYIREQMHKAPIPEGFKGIPSGLIAAAIMSLLFKGFVGLI